MPLRLCYYDKNVPPDAALSVYVGVHGDEMVDVTRVGRMVLWQEVVEEMGMWVKVSQQEEETAREEEDLKIACCSLEVTRDEVTGEEVKAAGVKVELGEEVEVAWDEERSSPVERHSGLSGVLG